VIVSKFLVTWFWLKEWRLIRVLVLFWLNRFQTWSSFGIRWSSQANRNCVPEFSGTHRRRGYSPRGAVLCTWHLSQYTHRIQICNWHRSEAGMCENCLGHAWVPIQQTGLLFQIGRGICDQSNTICQHLQYQCFWTGEIIYNFQGNYEISLYIWMFLVINICADTLNNSVVSATVTISSSLKRWLFFKNKSNLLSCSWVHQNWLSTNGSNYIKVGVLRVWVGNTARRQYPEDPHLNLHHCGNLISFIRITEAGAWSWPLTSIYCRGQRMSGAIPQLSPYAFLEHRETSIWQLFWLSNAKKS
jgi:hypothetical protein